MNHKTKVCTKCHKRRFITSFRKDARSTDGCTWRCKSCLSMYERSYRVANRKKVKAARAAWLKTNPDYHARWQETNRKKRKFYAATWRQTNLQIVRAKSSAQRKTITDRYRQMLNRHKRKLIQQGCAGEPMTLAEYRIKLYFRGGRERPCFYCFGESNKMGGGLDRLNNRATYTFKNTVPSCFGCNSWRGRRHTVQETLDHFKPMRDAVINSGIENQLRRAA